MHPLDKIEELLDELIEKTRELEDLSKEQMNCWEKMFKARHFIGGGK